MGKGKKIFSQPDVVTTENLAAGFGGEALAKGMDFGDDEERLRRRRCLYWFWGLTSLFIVSELAVGLGLYFGMFYKAEKSDTSVMLAIDPTPSVSPTLSATPSESSSPSTSGSPLITPSSSSSASYSPSSSASSSASTSATASATASASPSPTASVTVTSSYSPSSTSSVSPTNTISALPTTSETPSSPMTPSPTPPLGLNEVVAFAGSLSGSTGQVNAIGTSAKFNGPYGIEYDPAGFYYVADSYGNAIRQVDASTRSVTTLAGRTSAGYVDAVGTNAKFDNPADVAYNAVAHVVYVADQNNGRIRVVDVATQNVTTLAGGSSLGIADGAGTNGQFDVLTGIAYDGVRYIYAADLSKHVIRRVDLDNGAYVSTLVGKATVYSLIDGIGTDATFYQPYHLVCAPGGTLFVADFGNNAIRKVDVNTRDVITVAGGGPATMVDGTGTNAQFNGPLGIDMDTSGNVLIVEMTGNRVRKMNNITYDVTIVVGDPSSGSGFVDGVGTDVLFMFPGGIAVDNTGNAMIGDVYNNAIRKLRYR